MVAAGFTGAEGVPKAPVDKLMYEMVGVPLVEASVSIVYQYAPTASTTRESAIEDDPPYMMTS